MMREPRRWKDSSDVDEVARELLRAGRRTASLPSAARMRGERRVSKLAAAPVVVLGAGLLSKTVAAAFGAGFASALALVSVSPGLVEKLARVPASRPTESVSRVVESGTAAPSSAAASAGVPDEPPHDAAAPAPFDERAPTFPPIVPARVRSPALSPARSSSESVEPRPVASSALAQPAPALSGLGVELANPPASSSAAPADPLSAEVQLLARARALVSTDPNGALDLLNQHARSFPGAALAMEREVLVIEALRRSGRAGEARARARELLAGAPGALYAARLKRIVDADDSADAPRR